MSDDLEDRLRGHLAATAAGVDADPDPDGLLRRATGRSPRRPLVAAGVAVLAAVVAGAGILVGATVVATSPTASTRSPSATAGAGRAGADLVPSAGDGLPDDAGQTALTFLFSRLSPSGVTVRAFSSAVAGVSGCSGADCAPPVTVPVTTPCATGDTCARPLISPPVSTGTGASAGSSGASSSSGSSSSTDPSADCTDLVIELSTDRAVGTGSVVRPSSTTPSPDTVEVLGSGSFGSAEGSPAGWVAVWVGDAVASVQLTDGGAVVDAMDPVDGVAVLADAGAQGASGDTVVGLGATGAALASQPADQSGVPDVAAGCPVTATPSTTTTTTTPPTTTTTAPSTTTTTVLPVTPPSTISPVVVTPGVDRGTAASPGA
jgi:hypothetical protein